MVAHAGIVPGAGGGGNAVLNIEELSEEELDEIKRGYAALASRAIRDLRRGKSDFGTPEIKKKSNAGQGCSAEPVAHEH